MKRLFVSLSWCIIAPQLFAQFIFPTFEQYLGLDNEALLYACNAPLYLESVNEVFIELEPLAYHINNKMTVVGFALYLPDYVSLKKATRVHFLSSNNQRTSLKTLLVDPEEQIVYVKFTMKDKLYLKDNPIRTITIRWGKHKWTSLNLTPHQSHYFMEVMDQEMYQLFTPINRLNPFYYDE